MEKLTTDAANGTLSNPVEDHLYKIIQAHGKIYFANLLESFLKDFSVQDFVAASESLRESGKIEVVDGDYVRIREEVA